MRASLSMGLLSLAFLELIHCLECGQVSFKVSAEKAQECLGRLQDSEVLSTAVLTMENRSERVHLPRKGVTNNISQLRIRLFLSL